MASEVPPLTANRTFFTLKSVVWMAFGATGFRLCCSLAKSDRYSWTALCTSWTGDASLAFGSRHGWPGSAFTAGNCDDAPRNPGATGCQCGSTPRRPWNCGAVTPGSPRCAPNTQMTDQISIHPKNAVN